MASLHACQEAQHLTFKSAIGGSPLVAGQPSTARLANESHAIQAMAKRKSGTISLPRGLGFAKKPTTIDVSFSEEDFRDKTFETPKPAPRILSRMQELRLLSKLEDARLLSTLEKSGLTLSKIEQLGLLSLAEKAGVLSITSKRTTPALVFAIAIGLLALGPAVVYYTPDDSTASIIAQVAIAGFCALGGAAALGGASLLFSLQK